MTNQGDLTGKCHKSLEPLLITLLAMAVLKMLTSIWNTPDVCP